MRRSVMSAACPGFVDFQNPRLVTAHGRTFVGDQLTSLVVANRLHVKPVACLDGLSLRYVSLVRRCERVPHPRRWDAFREAFVR